MRNIWTIMKKELDRVFKDKKLIFSVFILPGLMIFIIYSLMGSGLSGMMQATEFTVYSENIPHEISEKVEALNESGSFKIDIYEKDDEQTEEDIKELVRLDIIDFAIIFGEDNKIRYYINSNNMNSNIVLGLYQSLISEYNKIIINGSEFEYDMSINSDVAKPEEAGSMMIAMILPMLIMTFLFQGALSFGPESIAGDKERGTISTLLATPTKRSEIAIGKILSLSVLSILGAISSFIGILISIPMLLKGMPSEGLPVNISYGMGDYLAIFLTLISAVLVIIGIVSIVSAFARTVKEAASYAAPFMIITILLGVTNMFTQGDSARIVYALPIYNVVKILDSILTFNFDMINFIIMLSSNLLVAAGLSYVLTKMFESERYMFGK